MYDYGGPLALFSTRPEPQLGLGCVGFSCMEVYVATYVHTYHALFFSACCDVGCSAVKLFGQIDKKRRSKKERVQASAAVAPLRGGRKV